jgi:hypothetical protein
MLSPTGFYASGVVVNPLFLVLRLERRDDT